MKLSDLPGMKGVFIKKEELTTPMVVTIAQVAVEEVGQDDDKELKPVLIFTDERKLTLNKTNTIELGQILGEETDDWKGKKIELYHDPNVRFAGKKVGGVKVREAR